MSTNSKARPSTGRKAKGLGAALAAGAFAMALLLDAGTAQATEVVLDENNNVTKVTNLEVVINEGVTVYDVTFVFDTGFNVYGGDILNFQFANQDDAVVALAQVMDALNANSPVPVGAGPNGTDQFFVGGDEENDLIVAAGGENFDGLWDQCQTDCVAGVAVLNPLAPFTYAVFGPPSGGGPPPGTNKDDVVVDLGNIALWAWMNDAGWLKLNNGSPDRVTTGDMDGNGEDDVIADFASSLGGIFVKYNLGGWTQLANVASEQMTSGDLDNNGQDDVVIDAGASLGLWARMNNSSWLKLNNASPEQVVVGDMDNNGADDVIADFGVDGIFVKRNLGAWVKLHNNDPEDMTIGNLDNAAGDDLVVDFGAGLALWARMNDSSWLKLNNGSPDVMATGDIDGNGADDVLAGFATTVGGFWQKLNLGGWTQLNPNSPDDVVSADVTGNGQDDIVGDFGSTIGGLFIKRDQGAWVKQHNTSPDSMAPGELD